MFLDLQSRFSGSVSAAGVTTGQSITATAISDNVIDLRSPQATLPLIVDEAVGEHGMDLLVKTITATNGADAAKTLTVTLESDSTANLATSATVHASSGAITGATLVANYVAWRTRLPFGNYEQYLGLRYTVSVAFTAFQVEAFLTPVLDRNINYASGYSLDS